MAQAHAVAKEQRQDVAPRIFRTAPHILTLAESDALIMRAQTKKTPKNWILHWSVSMLATQCVFQDDDASTSLFCTGSDGADAATD